MRRSTWPGAVRFNQAGLWDNYTGPKNDTLQTEIPERWLEAVD
jgi:thiocyanate hydrolase subunit beta